MSHIIQSAPATWAVRSAGAAPEAKEGKGESLPRPAPRPPLTAEQITAAAAAWRAAHRNSAQAEPARGAARRDVYARLYAHASQTRLPPPPPPMPVCPTHDFPRATREARARAAAYVRASSAVHRQPTRTGCGSVDALMERCQARLEREARGGTGVTAWVPYVKPTNFTADAVRRQSERSRRALLQG